MFIKELKKDLNDLGYLIYPIENKKGLVKKFDVFDPKRKDYLITGEDTAIINTFLDSHIKYEYLICFHKKGKGKILQKCDLKKRMEAIRDKRDKVIKEFDEDLFT